MKRLSTSNFQLVSILFAFRGILIYGGLGDSGAEHSIEVFNTDTKTFCKKQNVETGLDRLFHSMGESQNKNT